MTQTERTELGKLMGSLWNASEAVITGRVKWLVERGVSFADVSPVLSEMASTYDRLPSVKDIGIKLAEAGAQIHAPMGIGNPAVLARMKASIMDGPYGHGGGVREAAIRAGVTVLTRLAAERAGTAEFLRVAGGLEDEEGVAYYTDRVAAFDELIGVEQQPRLNA